MLLKTYVCHSMWILALYHTIAKLKQGCLLCILRHHPHSQVVIIKLRVSLHSPSLIVQYRGYIFKQDFADTRQDLIPTKNHYQYSQFN